jgi:hypothetical protein
VIVLQQLILSNIVLYVQEVQKASGTFRNIESTGAYRELIARHRITNAVYVAEQMGNISHIGPEK